MKIIKNLHYNDQRFPGQLHHIKSRGPWYKITQIVMDLDATGKVPFNSINKKIGDGKDTLFWHDIWINDTPLNLQFPRLYALEVSKFVTVGDRWNGVNFTWNWRRSIRGGVEDSQLRSMCDCIRNITIVNTPDKWRWSCDNMNIFSVNGLRKYIDRISLPNHFTVTRWNKNVPRKVNIHVWRVLKDRLPTRFNLWFRGVQNIPITCPLCGNGIETIYHTLTDCIIARKVWQSIFKWLDLQVSYQLLPIDLLDSVDEMRMNSTAKSIIGTIIYTVWWELWRFRNESIFRTEKRRDNVLVDSIINFSFHWYHNRNKKTNISWDEWLKNPLLFT